jgi:TRAP-type C4-dicarboxylate transport system permease small subunit
VNTVSEVVLFGMILAMVGVTTLQIVCRIFFDALIWSEELTTYLLVASSLLGAAVGFKKGSHIAVTFLVNKLPEGPRKAVSMFVQCVSVFFFAVVAFYGAELMKSEAMQTTPAMGISMTWIYLMYPVIGGIILLHLVAGFGGILGRR